MSNIIIPPQHQSAPNAPVYQALDIEHASKPAIADDNYSGPCMESDDPKVNEMMRKLYKQSLSEERLNPQEEIVRQMEKSYKAAAPQRWKGQERWQGRENEAMRLVNIIHPHTFIDRLNRAGIRASLDAEMPGQVRHARIWLNSFSLIGRIGVNAWVDGEPTTVTTLQYPYGPEWSIMRFDEKNVPTNEKYRGWRTTLLTLICTNVVTEEEAHRAFGKPIGMAASFYLEQLYEHRKIRLGLAPKQ